MYTPSTDPCALPSGALRNNLGIDDPAELAAAEADITGASLTALGTRTLTGKYDLDHLRAFHRFIFEDIYPWAGKLRTVDINYGRAQRAFLQQLAQDVGSLSWAGLDTARNEAASIAGFRGQLQPLVALLDQHVSRP